MKPKKGKPKKNEEMENKTGEEMKDRKEKDGTDIVDDIAKDGIGGVLGSQNETEEVEAGNPAKGKENQHNISIMSAR